MLRCRAGGSVGVSSRTLGGDEGSDRKAHLTQQHRLSGLTKSGKLLISRSRFEVLRNQLLTCRVQPRYHNPRVGGSSPSSATNRINDLTGFDMLRCGLLSNMLR